MQKTQTQCASGSLRTRRIMTSKRTIIIPIKLLKLKYITEQKPVREIAKEFNCSPATIVRRIVEYNIKCPKKLRAEKISFTCKERRSTKEYKEKHSKMVKARWKNTEYIKKWKAKRVWKARASSTRTRIRQLPEGITWRKQVFQRDRFTCQNCGKKGGYLEAHHIVSFSKILKDYKVTTIKEALSCKKLWDITNGQTLCKPCHMKTKNYRRPRNGKCRSKRCRRYN